MRTVLSREDIEQLEAGLITDGHVARLLGWTTRPSGLQVYDRRRGLLTDPRLNWVTPDGLGGGYAPPRFSRDWQLVPKLIEWAGNRGYYCRIASPFDPHQALNERMPAWFDLRYHWWVYFERHGWTETSPSASSHALDAPLAVCKALLLAFSEDEKE